MKAPLSENEFEILNHRAGVISAHLAEVANLLESRLGEVNELTSSARTLQEDFAAFARKIHAETAILRCSESIAGAHRF